mgnify:CR=1 FL=1
MTLKILSREDYEQVSATFKERSFMQSVEMADLLEKRGFDITFLGLEADAWMSGSCRVFCTACQ